MARFYYATPSLSAAAAQGADRPSWMENASQWREYFEDILHTPPEPGPAFPAPAPHTPMPVPEGRIVHQAPQAPFQWYPAPAGYTSNPQGPLTVHTHRATTLSGQHLLQYYARDANGDHLVFAPHQLSRFFFLTRKDPDNPQPSDPVPGGPTDLPELLTMIQVRYPRLTIYRPDGQVVPAGKYMLPAGYTFRPQSPLTIRTYAGSSPDGQPYAQYYAVDATGSHVLYYPKKLQAFLAEVEQRGADIIPGGFPEISTLVDQIRKRWPLMFIYKPSGEQVLFEWYPLPEGYTAFPQRPFTIHSRQVDMQGETKQVYYGTDARGNRIIFAPQNLRRFLALPDHITQGATPGVVSKKATLMEAIRIRWPQRPPAQAGAGFLIGALGLIGIGLGLQKWVGDTQVDPAHEE